LALSRETLPRQKIITFPPVVGTKVRLKFIIPSSEAFEPA